MELAMNVSIMQTPAVIAEALSPPITTMVCRTGWGSD
jgi:hypothetical protein